MRLGAIADQRRPATPQCQEISASPRPTQDWLARKLASHHRSKTRLLRAYAAPNGTLLERVRHLAEADLGLDIVYGRWIFLTCQHRAADGPAEFFRTSTSKCFP